MRNLDSIAPLTGIGNKVLSGKPIIFMPDEIKVRTTLRESMPIGTDTFWLDKTNALQLYDEANNLFSIAPTSIEYVDAVIAKRGLYVYDSTPLTSTLSEYNLIVDENLIVNGYDWNANRAFGLELTNAMNLVGLRMKIKLNDQAFVPAKWHSSPAGNFTTYYSTDNINWTKIVDCSVNNGDNELRWFSDAEAYYCYLDFWFDEVIDAKYFKVFADHTFLMADIGNTLTDTFDVVELFGYPYIEEMGDYIDGFDEDHHFAMLDTPEDYYYTYTGGVSRYYGYCSQCDSSSFNSGDFKAIKNSRLCKINYLYCEGYLSGAMMGVNMINGWNMEPPEFHIMGSNDNIFWKFIETLHAGEAHGWDECINFSIELTNSILYKYVGIIMTEMSDPMEVYYHWDDGEGGGEDDYAAAYFSSLEFRI